MKRKPPFKKKAKITWDDMEETEPQEDEEANLSLIPQIDDEEEVLPQGARTKPWYLDNGCSRHMIGNKNCFLSFEKKDGGLVTLGNNDKGKIRGKSTIGKLNSAKIENVQYVEGLKHNLLIISQLCDSGFEVIFKPNICELRQTSSNKLLFSRSRKKNLYVLDLNDMSAESCFISLEKR